jgi:diguanylate cyclase (GGDEF)-like protein
MSDHRNRIDSRGLFFSHELRVALWYLLDEEFPPAQHRGMGSEIGGEGQQALEERLRKDLNRLHLASGESVAEILRNFIVMLARPFELIVLLEMMTAVLVEIGPQLRQTPSERHERLDRLKARIIDKLNDFGLPMMFDDRLRLVLLAVDTRPAVLENLPRADDLVARLQPLIDNQPVVSLLFLDVDGLKAVNDRIGHDAGTACLARLVETMSSVVVGRGSIFRYGGDEFVVALPNFDLHEATATAARLRHAIEGAAIGDPPLTASIGVASSANERAAKKLVDHADQAAYASKFGGKNRLTTWPLDEAVARAVAEARHAARGR